MIRAQWIGGPDDGGWVELDRPFVDLVVPTSPPEAVDLSAEPSPAAPMTWREERIPIRQRRHDGRYVLVWPRGAA